jgi:hypothetical protein
LLLDAFSYPDGPLSTASGGAWTTHSGTDSGATALNVSSGTVLIVQHDTSGSRADDNRLYTGGPTIDPSADNTTKIYSSFTISSSGLPVNGDSDGSYFAHLKSSAANEFYGRIGANTNGAAPGTYRLAIANESWNVANTVEFPLDLNLNTTYTVISRLDLATDQATLWVNPVSEASLGVTATDALTYSTGAINAYALRQGTSGTGAPGDFAVDNLRVGTSFADVVPEPSGLALLGATGLLLRRRRCR